MLLLQDSLHATMFALFIQTEPRILSYVYSLRAHRPILDRPNVYEKLKLLKRVALTQSSLVYL